MPRFLEEDYDRTTACCDHCGRYINEDNTPAEFTAWNTTGESYGPTIDGCHECHLENAKDNAIGLLRIDALEDAMNELATALGIKVGA